MRVFFLVATALAVGLALAGPAQAQVINGQSTDDAAYAPRPPARWHSPESQGETPGRVEPDEPSRAPDEAPRER